MKSAYEILARVRVDGDFPSDRSIHLREQRRRDLNEGNASQVNCCGKPGEVARDSAAERNDRVTSLQTSAHEKSERAFERSEILETLAVIHQPVRDIEACGAQGFCALRAVKLENFSIGDKCYATRVNGERALCDFA